MANATWSTTQVAGTAVLFVNFPQALLNVPFVSSKLNNFAMFRADVDFEVKLNATKFHRGALQVAWIPGKTLIPHDLYRYSGLHSQILSASSTTGVSGTIPYFNRNNYANLINKSKRATNEFGSLIITVAVALDAISGANTSVEVTVFASFSNVVLNGPSEKVVAVSSRTPRQRNFKTRVLDAPKGKPVEAEAVEKSEKGVLTGVSEGLHTISASLSSLPIIGGIASAVESITAKTTPFFDALGLAKPINVSTTEPSQLRVASDLCATDGVHNSLSLGSKTDAPLSDMNLSYREDDFIKVAQVPMMIDSFEHTFIGGSGTEIKRYSATPYNYPNQIVGPGLVRTYLGAIAECFQYWRGSIKFRFHFICNTFTSTRVRISHVPGSAVYVGNPEAWGGTVPSTIVDIRGDTIVDFTVPYVSERMYTSSTSTDVESYIVLSLVNNAISPDIASIPTIGVLVYTAAGEDFQVLQLRNYPTTVGVREDFQEVFEPLSSASFNPESGVLDSEHLTSFNSILSRYHPYSSTVTAELTVEPKWWLGTAALIMSMFICYRGSMHVKVIDPAWNWQYIGLSTDGSQVAQASSGMVPMMSNAAVQPAEVLVPFYKKVPMEYIHLSYTDGAPPKLVGDPSLPSGLRYFAASGSDFQLYGLVPPAPRPIAALEAETEVKNVRLREKLASREIPNSD